MACSSWCVNAMQSMPPPEPESMTHTVTGPAGAGKSSVARSLAQRLGFRFLDTGATYRAVALAALPGYGKLPGGRPRSLFDNP